MYHNRPTKNTIKVEITLPKVLSIVIALLGFFILPIQLITYLNSDSDAENTQVINTSDSEELERRNITNTNLSRVAGASDTIESNGVDDRSILDLNTNQKYYLLGTFFLTMTMILMIYLLNDHKNYKKKFEENL